VPRIVATVVKRGYRLAIDPVADPGEAADAEYAEPVPGA
jgi:hypothetical protein